MSKEYRIDTSLVARYSPPTDPAPIPVDFCLEDPWPDDPGLTPESYDKHEAQGSAQMPSPLITAFRPLTFEQYGFPTRIRTVSEILRYADWNYEYYGARLFAPGAVYPEVCFVNAFSRAEWSMIDGLGRSIARMTEKRAGRAIRPVTVLMNAISPLRIVHHLASLGSKPITLFEVGPGMAYLGPMLAKIGHRYRCFDVTQAFCLWQHHMLRWSVGRDFAELIDLSPSAPIPDHAVVNLPWWRYVGFLFDELPPAADVVFSSSNLCEMTNDARRCVLEISHRMLSASPLGALFYLGPGAQAQCTAAQLQNEIENRGFHRVEDVPFCIWTARKQTAASISAAFRNGIPFFNPDGRPEIYPANTVMRISRREAPVDTAYAKWVTGWEPPYVD